MNITNDTRAIVSEGLRKKGMSQAALAKKLGVNRAWATKFFNGKLKSLSDDHFITIQEVLDIDLATVSRSQSSGLAESLAHEIEKSPEIGEAFNRILGVMQDDHYYDMPMIPTKDLVDFGKVILRASHEDPDKPGKVGKVTLNWLSERLQKLKP